jgi:hypothetical protein
MDLNTEINFSDSRFTIYGNCLRLKHVNRVVEQKSARRVALVTYHSLNAILSNRLNHDDSKDSEDRINMGEAVSIINERYLAQLHVIPSMFLPDLRYFFKAFTDMGWKATSFEENNVIVLTRSNQGD